MPPSVVDAPSAMANTHISVFVRRRQSAQTSKSAHASRRSGSYHPHRDDCITASEGADCRGSLQKQPIEPLNVNSAVSFRRLYEFAVIRSDAGDRTSGCSPELFDDPRHREAATRSANGVAESACQSSARTGSEMIETTGMTNTAQARRAASSRKMATTSLNTNQTSLLSLFSVGLGPPSGHTRAGGSVPRSGVGSR